MRNRLTIIIFLLILFGFSITSLVWPDTDISERENRVLASMPEADAESILSGEFQEDYETYISDQFFLRDAWVDLSTGTWQLIGKKDINSVYIGKDGYLIEKYTDADFDEELVEGNIATLSEFINSMADIYGNGHVRLVMIPAKANAMPDIMPAYAVGWDESEVISAISGELSESQLLLDLTETLQAHQDEYIYYRTDHHWTTLGAYYAYAAYAQSLGYEVLEKDDFEIETVADDFYGTTYNKLHSTSEPDAVQIYHTAYENQLTVDMNDGARVTDSFYFMDQLENSDKYRVFFRGNTAKIVVDTGAGTGRTLLIFKDSYANCFVPFLSGDYDRIIMIDLRYLSDTVSGVMEDYEDEITDVLVMFNVEKFMQDENITRLTE